MHTVTYITGRGPVVVNVAGPYARVVTIAARVAAGIGASSYSIRGA